MKSKHTYLFLLSLLAGMMMMSSAATITPRASGDWNSTSTWKGGVIPRSTDDVNINSSYNITISSAVSCDKLIVNSSSSLTMNADLTVSELTLNSNSSLTVNCNTLTITNGRSNSASTVVFMLNSNATFNNTCCGTLKFTNGGALNSNHSTPVNLGRTIIENKKIELGQNPNQYNAWNFDCGLELNGMGNVTLPWCKTYTDITLTNTTLNPGSCANLSGTLQLNAGGDIVTNALTYGANSKVIFNRDYTLTSTGKVWATGNTANTPPQIEVWSGTIATNDTVVVKTSLRLLGGTIGTPTGGTKVRFANNSSLYRCGGTFASTPVYGSNVTITYCTPENNQPVVIGPEVPSGGSTGDLVITTNVILGSDVSVGTGKKVIITAGGTLNDSNYVISSASGGVNVQNGGVIKTSKSGGLTGTNSLLGNINATLDNGSTVEFCATSGSQLVNVRTDYSNLTLSGNASKTFTGGSTYEISGNFTVSGKQPDLSNTTLNFDGANQQIAGVTYYNLTCSNTGTKTVSGSAVVTNIVTVSGSSKLNTNDNLSLRSDGNGTASIGPLLNGADIIGNVCWERFVPGGDGRRRWRFLSMPILNQTFRNAWQDEIFITGPGTGGVPCDFNTTSTASMVRNSNGFDQNHSGAYTIYTWNEITGTWATIPTVFDTINPLKAYRTFVRGNRNIEGCLLLTQMPDSVSDVTIRSCGAPVKFNQSVPLTVTTATGGGWNYVSNPYPSAIAWNNSTWTSARGTDIDPTIYIYNPVVNQYTSWHPIAGSVNGGSPYIASGQSFFVKANRAVTMTFQEVYKADASRAGYFGKTGSLATNRLSIKLTGVNISDEMVVYTSMDALNRFDSIFDGYKFGYATGSIAFAKKGEPASKLAFGAIKPVKTSDTVAVFTSLPNANGTYTLTFDGTDMDKMFIYQLRDKFTGTVSNVTNDDPIYTFTVIAGNAASYGQNRFELILTNVSSLPVKLTSFTGKKQHTAVVLSWSTATEVNNSHFVIERSQDRKTFEAIGTVKGAGNTTSTVKYSFADNEPSKGVNYYRLRQVDFNGKDELSPEVAVSFGTDVASKTIVYPVPAQEEININLNNTETISKVTITIVDLLGKKVFTQTVQQVMPSQKITLDLGNLQTGSYFINADADGKVEQFKFSKID